jgi:hypothetical protein
MNKIYCYLYSFVLTTPSRSLPHVATAGSFMLMALMLVVSLLMICDVFGGSPQMLSGPLRMIVLATPLLTYAVSLYYYVSKKIGARLVKEFGEKIHSKSAARSGGAILAGVAAVPALISVYLVMFVPSN